MTEPMFSDDFVTIHCGDCLDVMGGMDADSVDAIVTDPPYGLSFMGRDWDHGVPGEHFWAEALRVAKPGAYLVAFGGTRTFHRLTCAIEDAGWEIRDCLGWLYGSGFPKSLDVSKAIDKAAGAEREVVGPDPQAARRNKATSKFSGCYGSIVDAESVPLTAPATDLAAQWQGWGTALKPAWEPIILARKPLTGTVAANVQEYGTGAINVDGCRVDYLSDDDRAGATPQGKCTAKSGALAGASEYMGCDDYAPDSLNPDPSDRDVCTTCFCREIDHRPRAEFVRPEQKGRWPANIIHDGSDEVLSVFPQQSSGSRASGVRAGMGYHGADGDGGPALEASEGSAARFFYTAKATKAERDEGLHVFEAKAPGEGSRNVTGDPLVDRIHGLNPRKNYHPTVKPLSLMRWLVRLVTPPDGIVLDPFMGSGTTLKAARADGHKSIGIDLDEGHCEIAWGRLSQGVMF